MTILSAIVTQVKIGSISIEGLMDSSGGFHVALPQLVDIDLVPPNRSQKQLESLLGICFQSHQKAKTPLNPKAVNIIDIDDVVKIIKIQFKKGNPKANILVDGLLGMSLHQLFSDAFGIKFDAEERQAVLIARMEGIETRKDLTSSIKSWYERNPGGTTCPIHAMYARVTDAIYIKLWGMTAKELESYLGCGRHESRDNLDAASLKHLDRAEALVMEYIDEDNIKPIDAVALANLRPKQLNVVR